jgi:hypothetical protein
MKPYTSPLRSVGRTAGPVGSGCRELGAGELGSVDGGGVVDDSAGGRVTVTEFGAVGDGGADADVDVADEVVAAGSATPGVEVLHPVITMIGMSARRTTSEVRRVVFIFFASTTNDVPLRRTFRGSPVRVRNDS